MKNSHQKRQNYYLKSKTNKRTAKKERQNLSLFFYIYSYEIFKKNKREILETLIGMGYEIAYYRVEQSVDGRANSIFNFYIRMSRVN